MRNLLFLALFATGCSSVLGFEDFNDTGSGSGSGGQKVRITGQVTAWATGMGVSDVGVEALDREGTVVTSQTNTNTSGTYALNVPIVSGSVDGFMHFSTAGYLETYAHYPNPFTTNAQQDGILFGGSDVSVLHSQAGTGSQQAGTATMLVFAPPGSEVTIDHGTVFYVSDTSGDLDPSLTAVSLNGLAIVLNVADGTVTPGTKTHPGTRSYGIDAGSVAIVRLTQ